ncbi:aspartate aminotransferase family protein [Pseudalkalibacillus caeni]|uniref:Aspartate aminotransferase family protein n=2 Tax=Exobacillus caeni TaxID=2574798 RepID=A0A5R9F7M8_9BACL|nr:aspartate aminotransferase family protein [Pseudalkalibacillus caeni]
MEYPEISWGKGVYLYDKEGNRYIDGASGAITANIGHGVDEIAEAMYEQAKKVSFVYRSQFTSEPAEKLAERLAEHAPGDLDWIFFVNSGSEATETALKVAIQYWQEKGRPSKKRVISRWMSYHGITMGALSMSGHSIRRSRFSSLLEQYPELSPPYCYRCAFTQNCPNCADDYAREFETAIQRLGPETIAAFVFEPVIGAAGGAVVPPDGYFEKMKKVCDKYDILMIADEVMTGIGRTGKMFAMEHWNVQPDIVALGKGMSAGYAPMAATIVSDRIIQTIESGSRVILSGHTFSANPQSAATCLAVMDYIENNHVVQNAKLQGSILMKGLKYLEQTYPLVGEARGLGMLCGLELVADQHTKEPFPLNLEVTNRLIQKCYEKGLIVYTAAGGINGHSGDAIIVAPPLTVKTEELQELLTILEEAIAELSHELSNEGFLQTRSIS